MCMKLVTHINVVQSEVILIHTDKVYDACKRKR